MRDILWIPSWYPSIHSIQNGDFIERHAMAASKYTNIVLIHIQSSNKIETILHKNSRKCENLFEKVTIFPAVNYFRLFNFFRYFYYFNKAFKGCYLKNKKPCLIHVHVSYKAGLIALWLKMRYGIPYIITEHWSFFNLGNKNNYSRCNIFTKLLYRIIFNNSDYVLPVSENLNRQLRLFFPKIITSTIPNVVDNKLFFLKEYEDNNKFTFIHVSSFVRLKNPVSILETFIRLRKKYGFVELKLVGPLTNELMDFMGKIEGIKDAINCTGSVSHDLVANELQSANVFVLYSHYENLPCVIAESLCCGVPVISSSVGGVPEMVDESNGILVPPGDEDALYNAMESMILNYKKYDRQKISETAQAKYNPDVVGKQIVEVYEKVLSKK